MSEQAVRLEEGAKPNKMLFGCGGDEVTASLSYTEDERRGRGRQGAYKSLWRGRGGAQLSRELVSLRQKLGRVFGNSHFECESAYRLFLCQFKMPASNILTIHHYYM